MQTLSVQYGVLPWRVKCCKVVSTAVGMRSALKGMGISWWSRGGL